MSSYGTNNAIDSFEPYEFGEFGHGDENDFLTTGKASGSNVAGDLASVTVPVVSGNMGSGGKPTLDTLDEPVSATILRDLRSIWEKLRQVLLPRRDNTNILRDWDLWGPLLLCLALSIRLSITAPEGQAPAVFTAIFVIVWCGAAVVTLNSKLLGGKISFFQSVCVLGYCVFPLVIAAIVCMFIPIIFVRVIVVGVAFTWSGYASVGFLSDVNLDQRRTLAVYPIFLFYFVIGWMILISKSLFR